MPSARSAYVEFCVDTGASEEFVEAVVPLCKKYPELLHTLNGMAPSDILEMGTCRFWSPEEELPKGECEGRVIARTVPTKRALRLLNEYQQKEEREDGEQEG